MQISRRPPAPSHHLFLIVPFPGQVPLPLGKETCQSVILKNHLHFSARTRHHPGGTADPYVSSCTMENSPHSAAPPDVHHLALPPGMGVSCAGWQNTGSAVPPGDAGFWQKKVQMIFENDALASLLSQGERDLARERHDEKKVWPRCWGPTVKFAWCKSKEIRLANYV